MVGIVLVKITVDGGQGVFVDNELLIFSVNSGYHRLALASFPFQAQHR